MPKQKPKSHSQWIPSFIYWNLRLLSKKWESQQTQIVSEALLNWMNKKGLKTQDYYAENITEFNKLVISNEGQKFRDLKFSLKGMNIRGLSITKSVWLNLNAASLQTKRPMSAILIESLIVELEILGWVFLSEATAKKECLEIISTELTDEMVDSSEPIQEDDKFDRLFIELESKGLLDSRKSYTWDDLVAIRAEQREQITEVPEADDIVQRLKKLTEKDGLNNST